MKKISILALGITLGVLSITACSKDSSSSSDCCTLSVTFSGTTMTTKYCKVDANTVSASINGAAATNLTGSLLGGLTADQYMSAQRTAGCK